MKRIETLEDVKKAMELNGYLDKRILEEIKWDRDAFRDTDETIESATLKECKEYMAEALDVVNTVAQLNLYVSQLQTKIKDCLDSKWIPSADDCIQHYLDDIYEESTLYNLVIDDGKVYKLYENYCEKDDKTFITREEYYPSSDDWDERDGEWEMPRQECVGWYCGKPDYDATTQFYGNLG